MGPQQGVQATARKQVPRRTHSMDPQQQAQAKARKQAPKRTHSMDPQEEVLATARKQASAAEGDSAATKPRRKPNRTGQRRNSVSKIAERRAQAQERRAQEQAREQALFSKCGQVGGFCTEFVPLNSDVNQVFEAIDTNGDGSLTRAEVIKGLKTSSDVSLLVAFACC